MSKRSIILHGTTTSIFLEDAFWEELDRRAHEQGKPWQHFVRDMLGTIDSPKNRSAAIKVRLLENLRHEQKTTTTKQSRSLASRWQLSAKGISRTVRCEGVRLFIGRSSGNDIAIDDLEVSRRHAMLVSDDRNWWLVDLDSQNGIWQGRKRKVLIKIGDGPEVKIGQTTLQYLGK